MLQIELIPHWSIFCNDCHLFSFEPLPWGPLGHLFYTLKKCFFIGERNINLLFYLFMYSLVASFFSALNFIMARKWYSITTKSHKFSFC